MPHKIGLLLACIAVAVISSWPWLVQPNLRPGTPAPFEAIAPKDASVENSEALEQKRSNLVQSTFVQVIDQQETTRLKERLERHLSELERVANSNDVARIGPVNLSPEEQIWLTKLTEQERKNWDKAIRLASERMLSQGLVNSLAFEQLQQAASLQLADLGKWDSPARSLGSKLITNTFQSSTNLRTDPARSQRLIEELITKQGIPTI
ncbi:MAG TPA: HD family phosphohydrolase, partial [Prochlorococcus sp.]